MSRLIRTLPRVALLALLAFAAPTLAARAQTSAPAAPPPAAGEGPAVGQAPAASPPPSEPAPVASADAGNRVRASELIDQAKSRLDQVTAGLRRETLDDGALSNLKDSLGPASDQLQRAIEVLGLRLADAKERLDKLGPKPDAKAPPESADVARDREEQQKRYARAEELLKRAQLLALQIDQTSARIVSPANWSSARTMVEPVSSFDDVRTVDAGRSASIVIGNWPPFSSGDCLAGALPSGSAMSR